MHLYLYSGIVFPMGGQEDIHVILDRVSLKKEAPLNIIPTPLPLQTHSYLQESQPTLHHPVSFHCQPSSRILEKKKSRRNIMGCRL